MGTWGAIISKNMGIPYPHVGEYSAYPIITSPFSLPSKLYRNFPCMYFMARAGLTARYQMIVIYQKIDLALHCMP